MENHEVIRVSKEAWQFLTLKKSESVAGSYSSLLNVIIQMILDSKINLNEYRDSLIIFSPSRYSKTMYLTKKVYMRLFNLKRDQSIENFAMLINLIVTYLNAEDIVIEESSELERTKRQAIKWKTLYQELRKKVESGEIEIKT